MGAHALACRHTSLAVCVRCTAAVFVHSLCITKEKRPRCEGEDNVYSSGLRFSSLEANLT